MRRQLVDVELRSSGIDEAIESDRDSGVSRDQLWFADRNLRARRFYERNRFLPDGARYIDAELDLTEVRHVR